MQAPRYVLVDGESTAWLLGKAAGSHRWDPGGLSYPSNISEVMKPEFLLCLALALSGFAGCCAGPGGFRSGMEQAAAAVLPKGVQQVKFAYIGDVQTDKGAYHVVEQRRILTDMLAPRGLSTRLLLFSDNGRLAAAYEADFATGIQPLWCEGSRVYLAGFSSLHFDGSVNHEVPPDPRLARLFSGTERSPTGNVVNFSQGPLEPFLTREKRYGSSGGLEDDPWSSPAGIPFGERVAGAEEVSIHDAAKAGDLEKVKALLKDHPDLVFSRDDVGKTPLHWAAENGHKDAAEFLLANHAEVNAKENGDRTPLHCAAFRGHKDVAALLLAKKAKVNARDNYRATPLHMAAMSGRYDVVKLLLANKAEVNAKDNKGWTPLRWAVAGRHEDVAELLRQHGGHE